MRTASDVVAGVSALGGFGLMVWASLSVSSWAIWWGLVLLLGVPAVCAMMGRDPSDAHPAHTGLGDVLHRRTPAGVWCVAGRSSAVCHRGSLHRGGILGILVPQGVGGTRKTAQC